MSAQHGDDKAHVRDELDLTHARWNRAESRDPAVSDAVEWAFVPHTDGVVYTAMRDAEGVVNIYTPLEWDMFVASVKDGEFDKPW